MEAKLLSHRGARQVEELELATIPAPPPTETWFPISHQQVLDRVKGTLSDAGFLVTRQQLSLSRDDLRFFGTLDLATKVDDGVTLACGLRNSCDRSFPIGFCCGNRVAICDNLMMSAEIIISRRHTKFGEERFNEGVSHAVSGLHQYQMAEADRITRLQQWELREETADSLILRSLEAGIISSRLLPSVLKHWRSPEFEEFQPRTGYSLENAFTSALGEQKRWSSNPQATAATTMKLHRLLSPPENNDECSTGIATAV